MKLTTLELTNLELSTISIALAEHRDSLRRLVETEKTTPSKGKFIDGFKEVNKQMLDEIVSVLTKVDAVIREVRKK